MISINDRLMLECPENYNDMADQLDNEDNNEVGGNSHVNTFSQEVVPVNGNGTSNDLVIVEKDKVNAHIDDDEDLEDLEESLQALERLDRSSPDLWPDHIPGVGQFLPSTPHLETDTPRGSEAGGGYLQNLSRLVFYVLSIAILPIRIGARKFSYYSIRVG